MLEEEAEPPPHSYLQLRASRMERAQVCHAADTRLHRYLSFHQNLPCVNGVSHNEMKTLPERYLSSGESLLSPRSAR